MQIYVRIIDGVLDLEYTLPISPLHTLLYEDRRLTVWFEDLMIAAFEKVICWYKEDGE